MFEELSQHILDIAMNSLSANAKQVQISILESRKHDWLVLRVRDDGRGMDAATLKRVLANRWSSKAERRKPVGLGLALLQQTSEMCGGHFHVRAAAGRSERDDPGAVCDGQKNGRAVELPLRRGEVFLRLPRAGHERIKFMNLEQLKQLKEKAQKQIA